MSRLGESIVACATPWGRGALAVVRLSGSDARAIVERICPGPPPWRPRRAQLRRVRQDGEVIDQALVTWMPGPRSATGEDVVELSCHGNPVLVEQVIDLCVAAGARPARPGEFTRRAVEHGRLDLLQAEALAGLFEARSLKGVRVAQAGLEGNVGGEAMALREALLDLAAELECRLDHPGEDLGYLSDDEVIPRLDALARRTEAAAATWRAGRLGLHGARVALVGPVNAGKSSLFNGLLGQRRALVSPQPGTTRDVVEGRFRLDGVEMVLFDTAGERTEPEALEAAGLDLSRELTRDVDLRLVVVPLHRPVAVPKVDEPHLVVGTHVDLGDVGTPVDVRVSNHTGAGLDELRGALRRALGLSEPVEARAVVVSQRQHDLFRSVGGHVSEACRALRSGAGPAVAVEEITQALERLSELDGTNAREAVLDRLFARFCVGK